MKKLFAHISFCLVVILLIPSCKSKVGMTKRHYSKGYYVSHSGSKSKMPIAKEDSKRLNTEEVEIIQVMRSRPKENIFKDQATLKHSESLMVSANPINKRGVSIKPKTIYKSIAISKPATEVRKTIAQLRTASSDRDGLSLFWLIILVILILWLFGFLAGGFGLGGLINILLVIALILLILWLLRVV